MTKSNDSKYLVGSIVNKDVTGNLTAKIPVNAELADVGIYLFIREEVLKWY